jgi:hypothetical protein
LGKKIETLENYKKLVREHKSIFDAGIFGKGIYFI